LAERARTAEVLTRETLPSAQPAARDVIPAPDPLAAILQAEPTNRTRASAELEGFLNESSPWKALAHWVGRDTLRGPDLKQRVAQRLTRDIARLDSLLNRQVNAILHDPSFQKLEASWRGLRYLVDQVPEGEKKLQIRVLNATWKEVTRDLERAIDFDQSQLFRKVYGEEFGHPGGEPFGVLLGDYEIRHRPGPDHPFDDVSTLMAISSVAAAAFAPFVTGVHPSMLDVESFTELERPGDLSRTFDQLEYLKWRSFRRTEDARFVGLTLPHVLMRLPYQDSTARVDNFRFQEEVEEPNRKGYLWGNACYAFGAVLIRAFSQSGWLAAIRGVPRFKGELVEAGGLVTGLAAHSFSTDKSGTVPKCSTDVIITDAEEKALGDLGFIPLCYCQDTQMSAFYGNQSAQKPAKYDEVAATVNAGLSAMLQYMLCVSRFAHYLKVMARDRIGSFAAPSELEDYLRRWLARYTAAGDSATLETRARFPLREARVEVRELPDKPGTYTCVAHLRPHFQLDQMFAAVRLVTEVSANPTA
jgi:type VI secretion system ImpC/EvpB family protein